MPSPIQNPIAWWNQGRTLEEATMRLSELVKDDWANRQRTVSATKGWWNPLRGMPGYGTLTGQGAVPGGIESGPTKLVRALAERFPKWAVGTALPQAAVLWAITEGLMPRPAGADSTLDAQLKNFKINKK